MNTKNLRFVAWSRLARQLRIGALAAAAIAATLSLPAGAQDKPVALKLSSWVPAQHPLNPALTAWAADITKACKAHRGRRPCATGSARAPTARPSRPLEISGVDVSPRLCGWSRCAAA